MATLEVARRHAIERPVVRVDGHRVGLTVEGDGEPLVLLHGIGRDRGDWSPVVPGLAERYRVYAIDLEGFGRSEPWGDVVTLASMARMVRRTLAAVREERPIRLVGNSMGGAVAMRMVADDPAGLVGLVLLSPAGFGRDASFGLRLLTVPALGDLLLMADATPLSMMIRARTIDRTPITRRLAEDAAWRMHRPGMRRQYLQVIHDLGGWTGIREGWRRDVLDAVARSGVPVLVAWGDRDIVLPPAHLGTVVSSIPHAEARSLPGLGHCPQLEEPELVVDLIGAFFG